MFMVEHLMALPPALLGGMQSSRYETVERLRQQVINLCGRLPDVSNNVVILATSIRVVDVVVVSYRGVLYNDWFRVANYFDI